MSFFIKSKHDKKRGTKRKLKEKKPKVKIQREDDEDLTSSSEEEVNLNETIDSESDNETVQERKLKLARIYLEEIEKEEAKRLESNDTNLSDRIVSQRLKDDYLKRAGKFKSKVADRFARFDVDHIVSLKCKEQKGVVTCMCVSNDNYLYTGSKCGAIVKWSLKDNKKLLAKPYFTKRDSRKSRTITSLAVTFDAKYLVSAQWNCIDVWNPNDFDRLHVFNGHRDSINGLVFRKDTHTLYSCSKDRSVKVWSLDEMSYVETLYGHQDSVTSIDALTRERAITSGGRDTTIRIWKIAEESQLIYNGNTNVDVVKLVNEETFASGGDGELCLWNVNRKKPLSVVKEAHGKNTVNDQSYWICSLGTLSNADLIVSGSEDGEIRLWRIDDDKKLSQIGSMPVDGFVNCVEFVSNGKYLAMAVGREHRLGRWHVRKNCKNHLVIVPLIYE